MSNALKRLRWRCRRGMRELDVLLDRYLEHQGQAMTANEIRTFERFLDATDVELYAWMTRRTHPADGEFASLVERILEPRSHEP